MRFVAYIAILSSFVVGCGSIHQNELKRALVELDNVIANKTLYMSQHQMTIESIERMLEKSQDSVGSYMAMGELCAHYFYTNIDSAYKYSSRKLSLARYLNSDSYVTASLLDLADIYINNGEERSAKLCIDQIRRSDIEPMELPRYYHIQRAYHAMVAHTSISPTDKRDYGTLMCSYRDSLLNILGETDINKTLVHTDILKDKGEYQDIIDMITVALDDSTIDKHAKARLYYQLGCAYQHRGQVELAVLNLTRASILDITMGVKEYMALYQLSTLLFEMGDIKRANDYINCSAEDVTSVRSIINISNITDVLPIIAHSDSINDKHRSESQRKFLILLLLFLLSAIIAMISLFNQRRKLKLSQSGLEVANERLKSLNSELSHTIDRLVESDKIKEAYVGHYIDLCSEYIAKVEKYRIMLNKVARNEGVTAVVQALKGNSYIDDILKEFYAEFDTTFLHIYPNFVEQVNATLKQDCQLSPKRGKLLNTELRIIALGVLGIKSSEKIAFFLRCSNSTIYNYKSSIKSSLTDGEKDIEYVIKRVVENQ